MENEFSRTKMIIGENALKKLQKSKVAVFGIGGVGGYVAEALARCSIGSIDLIDGDKVNISNINRQIIALHSTIGKYKAKVLKERILDINPNINIKSFNMFYNNETKSKFNFNEYDYIVDAIDSVNDKIELIVNAKKSNTLIISAMGAGNKMDPTLFEVSDIYKTSVCPLAKTVRSKLRKIGIKDLKVVYSKEEPIRHIKDKNTNEKHAPASISFVPSVMGFIIAGEVIKDIIEYKK